MKRYDTYKPSGIAWIGEVPEHWEPFRIKYALSRSAAGVWGDDEKGDENDILCYRIADFDYYHGCLMLDNLTTRNIEPKQLEGRIVKEGDLLIEKSGGGDASPVGRVVKVNSDQRATYTNFIHSVSVKDGYCSNYLYYYFFNLYALKINLLFFNQTTGLQNLKVGDYLGQTIFLPPLAEQEAIAAYLDARCADIDKVVATQQKRIALLQELKQSEITQAVTRGLNPEVRMKDSGVEWIGMVPEHWEVMKLNHVCETITDFVASGSFASLRDNVPYLAEPDYAMLVRTADLSGSASSDSRVYISKKSYEFLSNSNLFGGELLLPNIGSVGNVYMVPDDLYPKMSLAPNAIMVKTKYNDRYYYYYFMSKSGKDSIINLGQGTAQAKFNKTELRALKVALPPMDEQASIAEYLDRRCGEIDKQIGAVTKQIELLREYKQALITEVVTGKRKV